MTNPTSEDPFPPQFDVMQEAPAPFEDYEKFELTKQVNQEQLTDEINRATGRNVTLAVSGPEVALDAISESNPAELFVTPSKVDRSKVEKAIEDHVLDEAFGVPEAEQAFLAALQKVISDPTATLDDDEVRAAVHGLMVREGNRSNTLR